MQLTSEAFAEAGSIPAEHTCDGADTSPPLALNDAPEDTDSFALIVDDPDAGGFVHWVLTGIPGDVRELPAGVGDTIGTPGPNDFGRTGWGGPCPPSGEHASSRSYDPRPRTSSQMLDGDRRNARDRSCRARSRHPDHDESEGSCPP